jgi:hypothetical protein
MTRFKTIRLVWDTGDSMDYEYIMVDINTSKKTIKKCIKEALATGEDEVNALLKIFKEKGIKTAELECETYLF